jgi:hypothetical protein
MLATRISRFGVGGEDQAVDAQRAGPLHQFRRAQRARQHVDDEERRARRTGQVRAQPVSRHVVAHEGVALESDPERHQHPATPTDQSARAEPEQQQRERDKPDPGTRERAVQQELVDQEGGEADRERRLDGRLDVRLARAKRGTAIEPGGPSGDDATDREAERHRLVPRDVVPGQPGIAEPQRVSDEAGQQTDPDVDDREEVVGAATEPEHRAHAKKPTVPNRESPGPAGGPPTRRGRSAVPTGRPPR